MSSTRLSSILSLPSQLTDTGMAGYAPLLGEFFSLQDGRAWQLPVPDGDRFLRPANQFYDHTQPLFSEVLPLGERPEVLFLHPSFRHLHLQLRSKGLKFEIDWDSFLLCAKRIDRKSEEVCDTELVRRAGLVCDFYNSGLQNDVRPGPEQWQELRTIRFIPRHQLRTSSSVSFSAASYCVALPLVVSPSQLLRPEYEDVAWTQRALFRLGAEHAPNPILFAVDPSLGVPNAKEVVSQPAL